MKTYTSLHWFLMIAVVATAAGAAGVTAAGLWTVAYFTNWVSQATNYGWQKGSDNKPRQYTRGTFILRTFQQKA
jgi:hypothetical protein